MREVLKALRAADHRYVGLRPADATFKESPAFVLGQADAGALVYTMQSAEAQWPNCTAWSLIGSDELLSQVDPGWPPAYRGFRDPAELVQF